ncbi:MAG: lipoyl protein ligase domain-containing protein [Actinomycetota bacterium]
MGEHPAVGWRVEHWHGPAGEFHAMDSEPVRAVRAVRVSRPVMVLGSTQPESDIDTAAAARLGLDVARRRSGGGAVYLHPDDSTWVDITIPRDDVLWVDDVSSSMRWVGDAFAAALGPAVQAGAVAVHDGPFLAGDLSRAYCFAGLATGEVTLSGAKLVGVSQRRGRHGARLQCVVYHRIDPEDFAPCFADAGIATAVRGVEVAESPLGRADLLDALVAALPR